MQEEDTGTLEGAVREVLASHKDGALRFESVGAMTGLQAVARQGQIFVFSNFLFQLQNFASVLFSKNNLKWRPTSEADRDGALLFEAG